MKVLIVSTSDLQGGAAIAAFRLMDALNAREGVSARMVVRDKRSDSDRVTAVGDRNRNKWNFVTERAQIFVHNRLSRRNLFDVSTASSGVSVTSLEEFREADVIHLHWINQGMLSLKEIERIIDSGKRVVWTTARRGVVEGKPRHGELVEPGKLDIAAVALLTTDDGKPRGGIKQIQQRP